MPLDGSAGKGKYNDVSDVASAVAVDSTAAEAAALSTLTLAAIARVSCHVASTRSLSRLSSERISRWLVEQAVSLNDA
jgi:hypothetical protein